MATGRRSGISLAHNFDVGGLSVPPGRYVGEMREAVRKQWAKMASNKKIGGNSRLEKSASGRRSSKLKEGPVGEFFSVVPASS